MRHRQVDVKAVAGPGAAFVLVARHDRVEIGRIAMNRYVQHIIAPVEDFLHALPVVHIGI